MSMWRECSVCGCPITIRPNNTLRVHGPHAERCKGSGLLPANNIPLYEGGKPIPVAERNTCSHPGCTTDHQRRPRCRHCDRPMGLVHYAQGGRRRCSSKSQHCHPPVCPTAP